MKMYLAGNFAIMGYPEKEKKLIEVVGKNYCRLCSFYYHKGASVVLTIKRERNEPKRIVKRTIKRKTRSGK